MKKMLCILGIVALAFATPKTEVVKIIKADTTRVIKVDTLYVITYDTLKITKILKDTTILVKSDSVKTKSAPVELKKK